MGSTTQCMHLDDDGICFDYYCNFLDQSVDDEDGLKLCGQWIMLRVKNQLERKQNLHGLMMKVVRLLRLMNTVIHGALIERIRIQQFMKSKTEIQTMLDKYKALINQDRLKSSPLYTKGYMNALEWVINE